MIIRNSLLLALPVLAIIFTVGVQTSLSLLDVARVQFVSVAAGN